LHCGNSPEARDKRLKTCAIPVITDDRRNQNTPELLVLKLKFAMPNSKENCQMFCVCPLHVIRLLT
jgi:hypothetical protein